MGRVKKPETLKKTAIIQLKVREDFKKQAVEQAQNKGFGSLTSYIEHLVKEDKEKQ